METIGKIAIFIGSFAICTEVYIHLILRNPRPNIPLAKLGNIAIIIGIFAIWSGYTLQPDIPKSERIGCATAAVPHLSANDSTLIAEREKYSAKLKKASYSFNTPTSVKIDTPFTIYFLLNPLDTPQKLANKLRRKVWHEPFGKEQKIEADQTKRSAKMRVTLTGEDFEITPTEGKTFDGIKTPSTYKETSWSWRIQAKNVGEALPLYLNVWCELPQELGGPMEMIPTLNRYIRVDVTPIWVLNTYWERWKWILGGIGAALVAAFGLWWKSRHPEGTTS